MLVEGYKKTDVVVTGVTAEDISTNEVLKGQTDTKMLKIMVEAKGDLTPVEITAFDITGTDGDQVMSRSFWSSVSRSVKPTMLMMQRGTVLEMLRIFFDCFLKTPG